MDEEEIPQRAPSVGHSWRTPHKVRAFDAIVRITTRYFNDLMDQGSVMDQYFLDMTAADGADYGVKPWWKGVSPGVLAHHAMSVPTDEDRQAIVFLYEKNRTTRRDLLINLDEHLPMMRHRRRAGVSWERQENSNRWVCNGANLYVYESSTKRHRFATRSAPAVQVIHDPNTVGSSALSNDVLDSFDTVPHLVVTHWLAFNGGGNKRALETEAHWNKVALIDRALDIRNRPGQEILMILPTTDNAQQFVMLVNAPEILIPRMVNEIGTVLDGRMPVEFVVRGQDEMKFTYHMDRMYFHVS